MTSLTRGAGTADAQTTTFGYSGSQLTSVTIPANRVWGIGYDGAGRVGSITSPASGTVGQAGYTPSYTTQYTYAPGRTVVVAGAGTTAAVTTTYTLDAAGEATGVADGLGNTSRSAYDADHDVTTSTDANGNTTTNKYQYIGPNGAIGQVVEEDQPAIQAYSPQNGVTVSPVITHTYDPTSHDLLATGQPEGGLTTYTYDGHHSVVATTEQTTQQTCATTCPVTWRGTINGYDAYGERTATTDGRGVAVDANGNASPDPTLASSYTSRTSYDAQGDQTSSSTPPITTTLNGITTTAPVTTATTYDADGNQTTQTDANGNQTTYTYDHLGRQVATGRPAVRLWDGTTPATTVTTATVDDGAQGAGVDQFSYAGNWGHCANCGPSLYGRSNSWDGAPNDAATLAFSGTAVALYSVKDTNEGIAAISLDGGAEATVDLYASARTYNVLLWGAGGLAAGRHTLRMRVTGTKNAGSTGYLVGPDRADIGVPSAPAGSTAYDAVGNAVSSTDATGNATTSGYDPLGRLVSQTNPVSGATLMTYTADELTAQQDPAGNVTTYGYDAAGRPVQTTNPVTGTVQAAYDAAGNTTAVTTTDRTNGNATVTIEQLGYDALDRAITDTVVTDTANVAGSALTTLTRFDKDGNVSRVQRPNGDVVYDTYDAADQLTAVETDMAATATSPKYQTYSYDAAGNATASSDADGRTNATQYDGDSRAVRSVDTTPGQSGASVVTPTAQYDPAGDAVGQTTATQQPDGTVETHATTTSYDAAGQATGASDDGLPTGYGYDAAGQQRTQTIMGGAATVTQGVDGEGRVTSVGENAAGGSYTSSFGYNADDLPTRVTLPGGVTEAAGYDADNGLTSLTVAGPSTGVATTTLNTAYAYGYNAAGWTTSATTISGTDTIAHDGAGRLTAECGPQVEAQSPDHCYHWTYDNDGNVTSQVTDKGTTETYTYSQAQPNQLLRTDEPGYPAPTTYYSYDANGDTTAITAPVNGSLTDKDATNNQFAYDAEARPVRVTHLSRGIPLTATIGYNAEGARARYTVAMSGTTILDERFQYRDGALAQVGVISATAGGSVSYTDTYLYGPSGEPLELLRQQGGATSRYWYVLDGQSNVVALTDQGGAVVDRYNYDSWGEPIGKGYETVRQELRYNGYWWDRELEWYWLDGRYYDAEALRFLQPDPSALDGVRAYLYAGDDPLDASDLLGLACVAGRHWWSVAANGVCSIVGHVAHGVYQIAIGDDLDWVRGNNPFLKTLGGIDLASNAVSVFPVVGEVAEGTHFGVKASIYLVVFTVKSGVRTFEVTEKVVVRGGKIIRRLASKVKEIPGLRRAAKVAKGCFCFPAGTGVATAHGEQAIETLRVGDRILAEDPTTGRVEPEAVLATIRRPVSDLMTLDLSDGSAITVTTNHPFWVDGGLQLQGTGWVESGQLLVGDRLRTASGRDVTVVGLRRNVGKAVVYTLTVATDHTFFVGSARVLVHNCIDFLTIKNRVTPVLTLRGPARAGRGLGDRPGRARGGAGRPRRPGLAAGGGGPLGRQRHHGDGGPPLLGGRGRVVRRPQLAGGGRPAVGPYERTEERRGYRNGDKPRSLTTRVSTPEPRVPRVRDGAFSTDLFARSQRGEPAFILALPEIVVGGVSTRTVTHSTEELCGAEVSKSMVSSLARAARPARPCLGRATRHLVAKMRCRAGQGFPHLLSMRVWRGGAPPGQC